MMGRGGLGDANPASTSDFDEGFNLLSVNRMQFGKLSGPVRLLKTA
jgi:hypothetical protein